RRSVTMARVGVKRIALGGIGNVWPQAQTNRVRPAAIASSLMGGHVAAVRRHRKARAFRPPAEGELLSLACPRESNQREGHPPRRLPGSARQVRESRPGFSTGLLSWRKGAGIHADTPAGLSSTTHRLTRG